MIVVGAGWVVGAVAGAGCVLGSIVATETVIGEYNGLVFEVDRSLLRDFEGEFKKGAASASPASPAGANEAPALPFGQ
jgi:hypothetical protein